MLDSNIISFLSQLNAKLPSFVRVQPYENSKYPDFEVVFESSPFINFDAFNPSREFVGLVRELGKNLFKDKVEFSENKLYFWFG
jgi:hypothetical protein